MTRVVILTSLIFATPLLAIHLYGRLYVEQPAATDCPSGPPGSRAEQPLGLPSG